MIGKAASAQEIALQAGMYVAVGCFVVFMVFWGMSRMRKRMKKVADELGLQFIPSGPFALPVIKGYFADVEITLAAAGNNRRSKGRGPQTYIEALIPSPLPYGFQLSREDLLFKLGKALGGEEIELGDPQFDGTFKIYGEEVESVKALLRNPIVRNALLAFMQKYKSMAIHDSRLTVVVNMYLDKPEAARPVLTDIANLCRALASAQGMLMPPVG